MLKKLHILLLTLLAAVCFTVTAWADYDYIEQYVCPSESSRHF